MLDEYSEEFGADLGKVNPELERQRLKANPHVYQSPPSLVPEPGQNFSEPVEPNPAQNIPMAEDFMQAFPSNYNSAQQPQHPVQQAQPTMMPPPPPPQNFQQNFYQTPTQPQYVPPSPAPVPTPQYQNPIQYNTQPVQPQNQGRINTIFNEESKELTELLKEQNGGCLRNLLFGIVAILVVLVSFWASFSLGSKVFFPDVGKVKKMLPDFLTNKSSSANKLKDDLFDNSDIVKPDNDFEEYKLPDISTPVLPPEVKTKEPVTVKPKAKPVVKPKKTTVKKVVSTAPAVTMYRVVAGDYATKIEAEDVMRNIKADGFPVFMYSVDGKYRLQIGAFKTKDAATELMKKAVEFGYNAFISVK